MERLTSKDNPQVKQLSRLLADKKERASTGLFVTEGARLSGEAVLAGIAVETAFLTHTALERYPKQTDALLACAQHVLMLSDELAARVGDTQTPQGVYCVCKQPQPRLSADAVPAGRYLALEFLQDPGNVGTVLRTADAFGLSGVFLTADCPDIWSPKVLRATMGSAFRVPVCVTPALPALLTALSQTHATYAAVLDESAISVRSCNFSRPCVVVIGNEGAGLTPETLQACAQTAFVDMAGGTESLNAAVAAAVFMWEMARAAL